MKLSTTQAAERLNVSRRRVIALIEQGKLPAEKFSNVYMINEKDLALVENRKAGRPKKETDKE
ncbi:MAG: helix-turn-helix domain-containing protein [Acidobacteriota bacterium]|jgi:excisionase family DNA binding protein|nr:helix-turn-helix domain-containing protein [Acidobacteriota bacterium]